MLDFRILGPLEAVDDDAPVRLGGPKQRATLAILLLNANRVVSVERLADDLYSGAPPVTAVTQVQRQISELRKALGSESPIETRAPGYVIRISPDQLDLHRFERLTQDAGTSLARGQAERAAALLREGLELWRGPPLADFAYDPFAQSATERLEEIRLAALEQRIDADLGLGRHVELVGELEQLAVEHPLRERLRGQLMLALYRSGRQAEALDVYQRARETLVEELGIEPARALQELARAMLNQDSSLDVERAPAPASSVLGVARDERGLDDLVAVARPLAGLPARELILAQLVADENELERATASLSRRSSSLDATTRTAAFTTADEAGDIVRLASAYDVPLVLVAAAALREGGRLTPELAAILDRSPADLAIVLGSVELARGGGIFVPFGGGEHDWAALELGAWLSRATGVQLRLVGTKADPVSGRRDASRLLADASLAVQRLIGVQAEPLLAERSEESLVAAVEPASVVLVGISPRWRVEGIGATRRALLRARPPAVLVHRGPRPGGLAPAEAGTRFSWTIEPRYLQAVSTAPT